MNPTEWWTHVGILEVFLSFTVDIQVIKYYYVMQMYIFTSRSIYYLNIYIYMLTFYK